jgi:C4-dicarboxylate-specific signal transduction histidine kinase
MKDTLISEVFPFKLAVVAFALLLSIFSLMSYFHIRNYGFIADFNEVDVPVIQLTSTQIRLISELAVMVESSSGEAIKNEFLRSHIENLKFSLAEIENLIPDDRASALQIVKIRALIDELEAQENMNLATIQELRTLVQNYIEGYLLRKNALVDYEKKISSVISILSLVSIVVFLFSILVVYRKYQNNLNNISILSTKLEQEQVKSINTSKLASIGEMAAGLAHEINNPLAVIVARTDLMMMKLEANQLEPEQLRSSMEKISLMAGRISKIIDSVRKLSRGNTSSELTTIDLNEVIGDVLSLVHEKGKNLDIELISQLHSPLMVHSNYTLISQVIINLINNAIDELKKEEYQNTKKAISISSEEEGSYVVLRIQDSGKGIPLEVREKMFTPFFTTKEVGQGTGIGLSISLGLVKELKGELFLDPNPLPTVFVFKLPKANLTLDTAIV